MVSNPFWIHVSLCLCVLFVICCAEIIVLDDFDHDNATTFAAAWPFNDGAEFPPVPLGNLTLALNQSYDGSSCAVFNYNFTTGVYMGGTMTFSSPPSLYALSFMGKTVGSRSLSIGVRVVDSAGETFQFNTAPFSAADFDSEWRQYYIVLRQWDQSWGDGDSSTIQNPIKAVAINIADPENKVYGQFFFDTLLGHTDASVNIPLNITRPLVNQAYVSSVSRQVADPQRLLSGMGVNAGTPAIFPQLAALGISWIRFDFLWQNIELVKGTYDFTGVDEVLSAAQNYSLRSLIILGYTNDRFGSDPAPYTDEEIDGYVAYVKNAITHFNSIGADYAVEIYNEANGNGFGSGANYSRLLIPTLAAIREIDTNLIVLTSGLNGYANTFLEEFLATNQSGRGASGVGIHPYGAANPIGGLTNGYYAYRDIINQYYETYTDNDDFLPNFYDTEWGMSACDYVSDSNGHSSLALSIHANVVIRRFLSSFAFSTPMYFYYNDFDASTDAYNRNDNFGLLFNNYTAKPAYNATLYMSQTLGSRLFVGFVETSLPSVTCMLFQHEDNSTDYIAVLWDDITQYLQYSTYQSSVLLNVSNYDVIYSITDLLNNSLAYDDDDSSDGIIRLTMTPNASPIYVHFATAATSTSGGGQGNGEGDSNDGEGDSNAGFSITSYSWMLVLLVLCATFGIAQIN